MRGKQREFSQNSTKNAKGQSIGSNAPEKESGLKMKKSLGLVMRRPAEVA